MTPAGLLHQHRHGLTHVLIVAGSRGQRLAAAAEFHRSSLLHRGALVGVDCVVQEELLTAALLDWTAVAGAASPNPLWAAAGGTLFLDRVTRLRPFAQRLLLGLALRARGEGPDGTEWCGRLISGCDEIPENAVSTGRFSGALLDCLDKVRLQLDGATDRAGLRAAPRPTGCGRAERRRARRLRPAG